VRLSFVLCGLYFASVGVHAQSSAPRFVFTASAGVAWFDENQRQLGSYTYSSPACSPSASVNVENFSVEISVGAAGSDAGADTEELKGLTEEQKTL